MLLKLAKRRFFFFFFSFYLLVAGSVEDPSGKWPSTLGSVIVLEAKYIPFIMFKDWMPPALRDNPAVVRAILSNVPSYPREYLKRDSTIDQMLIHFPVNVSTPPHTTPQHPQHPHTPRTLLNNPTLY